MSPIDPELVTIVECYRRGWFTRIVPGDGWRPCAHDAPGALPDLPRLVFLREHGFDGRWTAPIRTPTRA